ncbi:MAG: hypothetical protein R6X22_01855 [Gemmatimonadota bacterium]
MPNARAGRGGRIANGVPARRARTPPRAVQLVACLAALQAAGCGGDAAPHRPEGSAAGPRDSAGVPVRIARDEGWPPGAAWRLERDLVVGEIDGPLAFGRIADVAPRAAGGLWVVDAQAARVRGFDGAGREALSIGGPGRGPGEFRSPAGLVETDDGRVAVFESYPPRLDWFDADGRYLGAARVAPGRDEAGTRTVPAFAQWAVAPDGTPFADVFAVPVPGGDPEVRHALLRFPGDGLGGEGPDTVHSWRVPAPLPDPAGGIPVLPPRPLWAVGPDGAVRWTPGTPYEIRTLTREGGLAAVLRRPIPSTRLTPALRAALEAGIRRSLEAGGGPGAADAILRRLEFPEALPHVAGLWVSRPDGTLYVARYTEESVREERPTSLDVLGPDGEFLGELPLPEGFSPRAFTPEAAYGVLEDELEVPFAARFRIVRPDE